MAVNMIPVVSSNIRKVGYNEATSELYIQFSTGTYCYADVPLDVYADLLKAASVGKYVQATIKPSYSFTKVTDMEIFK